MPHCFISKKELPIEQLIPFESIKPQIVKLIQTKYPNFGLGNFIAYEELNYFRKLYLETIITKDKRTTTHLEKKVIESIHQNELLAIHEIKNNDSQTYTFGEKMSDKIASFGGSWTFIIIFFTFILIWMGINIFLLTNKPFDPYPFILLNLILSCIASIQAPIIMMSQNRQELKDRKRGEDDYLINLKSELEVRLLHEKIDHILHRQNQKLLDIQEIQLELLQEISNKRK